MRDLLSTVLAVDTAARHFYGSRGGAGPHRMELREACAELRIAAGERALYDRLHGAPANFDLQDAFERLLKAAYSAGLPWPEIVAIVNRLGESGEHR